MGAGRVKEWGVGAGRVGLKREKEWQVREGGGDRMEKEIGGG